MVLRTPTCLRQNSWLHCIYKLEWLRIWTEDNQQVGIHTSFHPFTEIGQIFHNKYVFNNNRTFQVEIWKIVWTKLYNVIFFQFLSIRCTLNKSETWERELPKKIPRLPPGSPRSLLPRPLGNRKSVSIYPRSAPDQLLGTNPASGHRGTWM